MSFDQKIIVVTGGSSGIGYALFLASDDSSFVNGTEIFADGGQAQV